MPIGRPEIKVDPALIATLNKYTERLASAEAKQAAESYTRSQVAEIATRKLVTEPEVIVPPAGFKFAYHVYGPALAYRRKTGKELPVMAVRHGADNYRTIRLYHRIEVLGPSDLEPMWDNPLPGTDGKGVAICFTTGRLRVWSHYNLEPVVIDTADTRRQEAIIADIIRSYTL